MLTLTIKLQTRSAHTGGWLFLVLQSRSGPMHSKAITQDIGFHHDLDISLECLHSAGRSDGQVLGEIGLLLSPCASSRTCDAASLTRARPRSGMQLPASATF